MPTNMCLIPKNLITDGAQILCVQGSVEGYEPEYLVDGNLKSVWRSLSTSSQTLTVTLESSQKVSGIALLNHNLVAGYGGSVSVNIGGTVVTLTSYVANGNMFYLHPSDITTNVISITINNMTADNYYQIGELVVFDYIELLYSPASPYGQDIDMGYAEIMGGGMSPYRFHKGTFGKKDLNYTALDETCFQQWKTLFDDRKRAYPFGIIPDPRRIEEIWWVLFDTALSYQVYMSNDLTVYTDVKLSLLQLPY